MCAIDHHVLFRRKEQLWPFLVHTKNVQIAEEGAGSDPCVSGEDSCPACMVLTPEQRIQLSIPSYKQRKKSEKVDKLVDLFSVSVIGPASSGDHMESIDMSEPSHSLSTALDSSGA